MIPSIEGKEEVELSSSSPREKRRGHAPPRSVVGGRDDTV